MHIFENYDSYTPSVLAKLRRLKLFIESLKSTERAYLILLMQRDLQRQKLAKSGKTAMRHALKQDALNYSARRERFAVLNFQNSTTCVPVPSKRCAPKYNRLTERNTNNPF